MDAALKKMFTFRQIRDLYLAALKDSGLGYRDVRKAADTFGNVSSPTLSPGIAEPCHSGRHFGDRFFIVQVYRGTARAAKRCIARERDGHTLQTTALD